MQNPRPDSHLLRGQGAPAVPHRVRPPSTACTRMHGPRPPGRRAAHRSSARRPGNDLPIPESSSSTPMSRARSSPVLGRTLAAGAAAGQRSDGRPDPGTFRPGRAGWAKGCPWAVPPAPAAPSTAARPRRSPTSEVRPRRHGACRSSLSIRIMCRKNTMPGLDDDRVALVEHRPVHPGGGVDRAQGVAAGVEAVLAAGRGGRRSRRAPRTPRPWCGRGAGAPRRRAGPRFAASNSSRWRGAGLADQQRAHQAGMVLAVDAGELEGELVLPDRAGAGRTGSGRAGPPGRSR